MPKYEVDIIEETVHRVAVEAEDKAAAEEVALKRHLAGESIFMAVDERSLYAKRVPPDPVPPRLTPWIVVEGHCAMRCLEGTDPEDIANRVAFIEKTPRVRVAPYTGRDTDFRNWESGPKGSGGGDGVPAEDLTCGFDPVSRTWCDAQLETLGYTLPTT